ncbi:MAG: hypothetical protein K1V81_04215 [Paramuribaculum sp.]
MKRLLSIVLLASALGASAQVHSYVDQQLDSLKSSRKVITFGGQETGQGVSQVPVDSVRRLVDAFYYDQFRHFQDPAAPYFLFMSKDAQLAMGVGGCVRMRAYFDWGGAVNSSGFAPYLIDINPDPRHDRAFGTSPAGTSLFFRVIGRNKRFGNYQLYIEANFNGYERRDFHLKKAYAVINNWTIGYASSTFSDPAAVPPTVDAQGPNNKVSPTNVLVRWIKPFGKRWSVALSAETPSSNITEEDAVCESVDDWMPDFAAFVQYEWSQTAHVRLAGILRTLPYRNMVEGKNRNKAGWGVQLSSVLHPTRQITLYGSVNGGKGYESLGGDLQIGKYDLIPDPRHPGEMYAPAAVAWNVGLQYNFTPSLFVSANYSQSHYMPHGSEMAPDEYKTGRVIAANVFWNLTPRIQVGAEFDMGQRVNHDGASRWARRASAMAQFSF